MLLGRFFQFLILGFSLLSPVSLLAGLVWSGLPDIPDRTGLAGSFPGVADGSLVVAGGSNFSNGAPWAGGTKIWHHRIFILNAPDNTVRPHSKLGYRSPVHYASQLSRSPTPVGLRPPFVEDRQTKTHYPNLYSSLRLTLRVARKNVSRHYSAAPRPPRFLIRSSSNTLSSRPSSG